MRRNKNKPVLKNGLLRVRILGDHPHKGEYGTVPVVDGKITLTAPPGVDVPNLAKVTLENCPHGVEACFVAMGSFCLA
jgi:hypothetical protein